MKEEVISMISKILSEETGILEDEINADTIIPISPAGFKTVARITQSIQGGGALVLGPQICTVKELADQCVAETKEEDG